MLSGAERRTLPQITCWICSGATPAWVKAAREAATLRSVGFTSFSDPPLAPKGVLFPDRKTRLVFMWSIILPLRFQVQSLDRADTGQLAQDRLERSRIT